MSFAEKLSKYDTDKTVDTSGAYQESFESTDLGEKVVINYQNCSWQKTAGLLFSEYICLAMMSFPWSYSVLGLVPGLIITVFVSLTVFYTGLIIGDFCVAHPKVTNICDIGKMLFWNSKIVWWITALFFIVNNTLIQSLHVLVGAKYFNTISDNIPGGSTHICSIVFSVVSAIICFLISLPRTLHHMSFLGYFSAFTMFVAVVLAMAFSGVQDHPTGYIPGQPVKWYVWSPPHTNYVNAMTAMLNIVYTFVGQITYPSFINEMQRPKDFKKALVAVTAAELVLFSLTGAIIYVYVGGSYMTAPAFGSLLGNYKKIAFSFALPTILFLGSLYSNVSSQFIFHQIFRPDSIHRINHTVTGWSVWIGLNFGLWAIAFVIAEVIPFFSDLLSLMSSLFDCWFGFVFWGVAYFQLKRHYDPDYSILKSLKEDLILTKVEIIVNISLIAIGLYIFGPGIYATVQSIIWSYESDLYGKPFTCVSNGLK